MGILLHSVQCSALIVEFCFFFRLKQYKDYGAAGVSGKCPRHVRLASAPPPPKDLFHANRIVSISGLFFRKAIHSWELLRTTMHFFQAQHNGPPNNTRIAYHVIELIRLTFRFQSRCCIVLRWICCSLLRPITIGCKQVSVSQD